MSLLRIPSPLLLSSGVAAFVLAMAAPGAQAQSPAPAPAPRAPAVQARPSAVPAPAPAPAPRAVAPAPRVVTPPAIALSGLPGYRHPEIPISTCKLVNAGRRDCVIPAMTAGRYVIKAAGSSMPIGAKPRQQLTIVVDNRNCSQAFDASSWSGSTRTIRTMCEITVLSDAPTLISIVYADLQALKTATGPEVTIERLRWSGVMQMREVPQPR